MLPGDVEAMFQQAFTESGVATGRPTAKAWVAALDLLRQQLKKCTVSAMHVYPAHLTDCPWCALDNQGVIYFIDHFAVDTINQFRSDTHLIELFNSIIQQMLFLLTLIIIDMRYIAVFIRHHGNINAPGTGQSH